MSTGLMRIPGGRGLAGLILSLCLANGVCAAEGVVKTVVAYRGQPFHVGRIDIVLPAEAPISLAPEAPCWISSKQGRALYPVCEVARAQTSVAQGEHKVRRITGWFLFTGDEPLSVTLEAGSEYFRAPGVVQENPEEHRRLLAEWWSLTLGRAAQLSQTEQYQFQVENYLLPMLSRRLELPLPAFTQSLTGRRETDEILGTLLGTESIRLAMQKSATLGKSGGEVASEPVPPAITMPPVTIPGILAPVAIEPMAEHVPAECFYMRCGNMRNYRWMRETIEVWGGDVRDVTAARAIDYGMQNEVESQLALKEGVLARLLGKLVIADLALIGTDPFFREGAAIGMVFQSTGSPLLGNQLQVHRKAALEARPGARERTVKIGGQEVSLLETPDHTLRSFYAIDGNFHLVTNSEFIARRFLEAGTGMRNLADLAEFKYARSLLPVSREDTLFVYMSDPFFAHLLSPQYRVEMTRRMQAEAALEVVQLARLAAQAERRPAGTLAELIAGKFLPEEIMRRADGSRPELLADGTVRDSLRGRRRRFLPICDVPVPQVTRGEAAAYREFEGMYRRIWQRMDPVAAAIRRDPVAGKETRERIVCDLHIAPLATEPYGRMGRWLGKPQKSHYAGVPGDLIALEGLLNGTVPWLVPLGRNLWGARDAQFEFSVSQGAVSFPLLAGDVGKWHHHLPLYFAGQRVPASPQEVKQGRSLSLAKQPENTTAQVTDDFLNLTFWHRWNADFEILSPQKSLPEQILPQLKLVKGERPAQIRFRVADLTSSRIGALLRVLGYCRARQMSQTNSLLMHTLMQQLRVPAEQARSVAEQLLGGRLVCPLHGEYKRLETGPGPVVWYSTAWKHPHLNAVNSVPESYREPLLEWFRGLEVEMTIDTAASVLTTHIELETQSENAPP